MTDRTYAEPAERAKSIDERAARLASGNPVPVS